MSGHVVVNDRTPQSLKNSSSLIWAEPTQKHSLVYPTPAPGAALTAAVQSEDIFAKVSVHKRGECLTVVTQTMR